MVISRLHAPDGARERLAPPTLVAGLALGIVLTLALLFNPGAFLRRIQESRTPAIGLYFAKALARDNHRRAITLLLVRREIETGHDIAALRALAPLLARTQAGASRQRIRWLYYRDLLAMNDRYPRGSAARSHNDHTLRLLIDQLRPGAGPRALRGLAREAVVIHDQKTAIAIYRDLARRGHARRPAYYALAAAAAYGLGHPRLAAHLYFSAEHYAPTRAAAARYFLGAMQALQSHNEVALAVREGGRHLGGLEGRPAILRRMIALARAANEPAVAARYAKQLLRMP